MWASTTDDNAVYEQSDKRMCQLINIRGTSASGRMRMDLHRYYVAFGDANPAQQTTKEKHFCRLL